MFRYCFALIFIISVSLSVSAQDYYAWVTAESQDEINLVKFNPQTGNGELVRVIEVGVYPTEIEGPHGIALSEDGKEVYVSIAHGNPYGFLQKFDTETGELLGQVDLGLFPASMELSKATGFLYIVNFNLHGEMVPSKVSVVDPDLMIEIAQIPTGVMPHGSRISVDGTKQYHVSMMTDELIEIDALSMEVKRRLSVLEPAEGSHSNHDGMDHSAMNGSGMDHENMDHNPIVKPTWASPHPTKPFVYVMGNGSNEIVEINSNSWEITRRFATPKGPYNSEITSDGKHLVVSYKGSGASGIWDLESGKEISFIENSRKVTHGVAISPDNKFAFLSVEGIGGEPGSVDVIDIQSGKRVSVIETGKQAGGVVFWKMEETQKP